MLGEGEFWKKGQRVKNWKRRHYKVREDGVLFYFEVGKFNKAKGHRTLSSVSIRIGRSVNVSDSGAIDFSVDDAVPVELAFNNAKNRFMELVFDSAASAEKFAQVICKVAETDNVPEFVESLQDNESTPRSSEQTMVKRSLSVSDKVSGGDCLLEGRWLKRGRVRNVLKKRTFRILSKKDGSAVGKDSSKGLFEYAFGNNGYFKKNVDVFNVFICFEPGTPAASGGTLDFSVSEIVPMEVHFLHTPISSNELDDPELRPPPGADNIINFALEGISDVENFCKILDQVVLLSNISTFLKVLKTKIPNDSPPLQDDKVASKELASPSALSNTISAPKEYVIVYEGVFIKRTRVVNSWKSRGFKLKKSVGTDEGLGYAQLEYKGFGGESLFGFDYNATFLMYRRKQILPPKWMYLT